MHGVASDIAPRRSPYGGSSTTPTPTRANVFELIQSDDGESLEALTRAQPRLALDRITDNGTDEKEALIFAGVQYAPPPEVVFRNAFDAALPGFLCFGFGMGEVACRCGGTLRIRLGDDLHAVAKRNGKTRAAYVLHRAAALASAGGAAFLLVQYSMLSEAGAEADSLTTASMKRVCALAALCWLVGAAPTFFALRGVAQPEPRDEAVGACTRLLRALGSPKRGNAVHRTSRD